MSDEPGGTTATYTDLRTPAEKRAERLGYLVAVLILVVGGATLRTPILNWICGPAIVVGCVAFLPPLFLRSSKRSQ